MYKVLYRKWRPQVFADVVGQPQVTITLKNELMAGRIAHAYLFTGSRGTGKTTCAKILAKAVNCLDLHDGDPCGNCEICRGIETGSVMDIVEIDAASNNGVDNIRMLREEANFTPAAAKYRVYIIDEVHMLSTGAFNALLKTLEEPPEHVIFILATTEVHKLPATILSRCQRFDFRRIPPQEIAGRLTYVAEQEDAVLEEQAGLLLARLADGALRDALSLLDQCLGRSKQVTLEVVQETVGLVGRDHLFALSEAVRGHDSSSALETIDRLYNASKDMARLCEELSAHYRGLMLIKTMKDARGILAVPDDEFAQMTKQALSTPLPEILHSLDTLQGALDKMYRGGDRRVEMEMALIKLCSPELDDSNAALIRRIEALERGIHRPGVSAPKQAIPVAEEPTEPVLKETSEESSLQEVVSEQVAQASIALPEISQTKKPLEEGAKRLAEWPEILRILKEYSVAISAAFTGSSAYVNGDYVLIDAKEMAFELLRKSAQRDKMREAIQQVTGRVYKLGPYRARKEEEAEVDPLLKLAGEAEEAGIPVTRT
ncbi:MAG: DNA polymerase III subunit gamma/tau [Anaeromassilibacillus sp.]